MKSASSKLNPAEGATPFLLRTDADEQVGFGHLSRCLNLATAMPGERFAPFVALGRSCPQAEALLAASGVDWQVLPGSTEPEEEARLLAELAPGGACLLDISHLASHREPSRAAALSRALAERFGPLVVADGLGADALCARIGMSGHVLFRPYFDAGEGCEIPGASLVSGPQYMCFGAEYGAAREKRVHEDLVHEDREARRVLVTFGGADPAGGTLKVLAALARLKDRALEVRVVAGPAFGAQASEAVRAGIAALPHDCKVLEAPRSLAEHMAWADLAVSASGLTKYELALVGVPAIFLSPDERLAEINAGFIHAGTGLDLGLAALVEPEGLARALVALADDSARRREMARRGRSLVDMNGAKRFLTVIRRWRRA